MFAQPLLGSNGNFRHYLVAELSSTLGSQLTLIAFPLLVLSLGDSITQAGLLSTCSLVARLALRLPAGQLVDRYDRRRLMLVADLARLAALGSIPLAHLLVGLQYWQMLAVAMVEGIGTAIFTPAAAVAVRDVVHPADLTIALSLSQSALATALLIGPALGGVLFSVDSVLPFGCDAASYAISAVLLIRLTVRQPERRSVAERANRFSAAIQWLLGQRNLLWILAIGAVLNLTTSAAEMGVVLTLRAQGESSSVTGSVMAGAGVGAVIGSTLAPWILRRCYPGALLLLLGAVWTAGFALFAACPPPLLIGLTLVLLMLATPACGVVVGEAILGHAPRDLLGRIDTLVGTSLAGLASLGPALMSVGIQRVGIGATWLLMSTVAAGVIVVAGWPLFRMRVVMALAEPTPSTSIAGQERPWRTDSAGAA